MYGGEGVEGIYFSATSLATGLSSIDRTKLP
jgi:hypothetical protein